MKKITTLNVGEKKVTTSLVKIVNEGVKSELLPNPLCNQDVIIYVRAIGIPYKKSYAESAPLSWISCNYGPKVSEPVSRGIHRWHCF